MMLDVQVPSHYPEGSTMVVIGDAPGKEDVDAKAAFTGSDGRCLQKACQIAGIDWATVGRTNLVKRRPQPDGNDFRKAFYETIEEPIYTPTGKLSKRTRKIICRTIEFEAWQSALQLELDNQHPNLVVALGNEAFEAITGYTGISNYRGSVLPSKWNAGIKVLCAEHPRYIVRGSVADFWFLAHDMKKAKREAAFPEIRRLTWEQRIPPYSIEDAIWMLSLIRDNPTWKWTLDVETRAGTLACFSIAYWNGFNYCTFCIPVQTPRGPYWNGEEECQIWEALSAACSANPYLCNQNIEYDIYYLLRYGVEPSGVWMDTMLAHALLYPEWPKSLAFLCSFYLDDVQYYKGEGRDWSDGDRDEQLWEYCCKDAVYTLRIVEIIDQQLKERNLYEFYHGQTFMV